MSSTNKPNAGINDSDCSKNNDAESSSLQARDIEYSHLKDEAVTIDLSNDNKPLASQRAVDKQIVESIWGDYSERDIDLTQTIKTDRTPASSSISLNIRTLPISNTEEETGSTVFKIISKIGHGGMGIVYAAKQTSLDRRLALKVIKDKYAKDKFMRDRFLGEAALTGDLDHPNIPPIVELGTDSNGTPFYVMKEIIGSAWDDVIKKKSLHENLEILLSVCDAVSFAHSKSIIHRDLKPENVMLGNFGEVYVVDWGLAAAAGDSNKENADKSNKAERLTKTTAAGGTPAYMAPEMATGEVNSIGFRSDVYLLGGMLFEIVTGKHPHTGSTAMIAFMNAAQNVIQEVKESDDLLNIAYKAMATDPDDRFSSVVDFSQALQTYMLHEESLELTNIAYGEMKKASRVGLHIHYHSAINGFQQALNLWNRNKRAKDGLSKAKTEYAHSAFLNKDYDLAESLLDDNGEKHKKLQKAILKGIKKRDFKNNIWGFSIAALVLFIFVIFVVISNTYREMYFLHSEKVSEFATGYAKLIEPTARLILNQKIKYGDDWVIQGAWASEKEVYGDHSQNGQNKTLALLQEASKLLNSATSELSNSESNPIEFIYIRSKLSGFSELVASSQDARNIRIEENSDTSIFIPKEYTTLNKRIPDISMRFVTLTITPFVDEGDLLADNNNTPLKKEVLMVDKVIYNNQKEIIGNATIFMDIGSIRSKKHALNKFYQYSGIFTAVILVILFIIYMFVKPRYLRKRRISTSATKKLIGI